jgi:hypothetical protein
VNSEASAGASETGSEGRGRAGSGSVDGGKGGRENHGLKRSLIARTLLSVDSGVSFKK